MDVFAKYPSKPRHCSASPAPNGLTSMARSWLPALAFIWGFLALWLAARSGFLGKWIGGVGYPLICSTATLTLMRRRTLLWTILGYINITAALVWVLYVAWIGLMFFYHPWK